MQGSDTSFSSKSAVEEGSQGVALGQVTFFTSLSGQSKALVSYVSLSLGLFSLGEKNQRNTGLTINELGEKSAYFSPGHEDLSKEGLLVTSLKWRIFFLPIWA